MNVTNIIFTSMLFISLTWTQSAGMLAKPGETLFSIEGQYENEDVEGGSVSTTAIGGGYVLGGNVELFFQYLMALPKSSLSN